MKRDRGRPPNFDRLLPDTPPDQAWKVFAVCADMDPEVFYDLATPAAVRQARSVCALCPVRNACLEYALTWREGWGMWGGQTPRERENIALLRGLNERGFRR